MNTRVLVQSVPLRILEHLTFWGCSYYILVRVFSSSSEIQPTDYIYTAVFLATIALGVYVNLVLLIPHFLNQRKFLLYGLLLALCVVSSTLLNQLTFTRFIDYLLPGYYFISYFSFTDLPKFMAAFTGITSLFKLAKGYFLLLEGKSQLMQAQKERSEAELQALRAQINPHFLFNSLNSIYALVLKHSEKAPETILKLSGLLRYILYETRRERVELTTELDHMREYVDLQRIRSGPQAEIEFTVNGNPGNRTLAPLLFLPLIENSFKHGIKGETGAVFVRMECTIDEGSIRFVTENNKGLADEIPGENRRGIGLENLTRRMGMVYPGKHRFEISGTETRFKTELVIYTQDET